MFVLAQEPEFGGVSWANQQNLHPVGLTMLVLAAIVMLMARRRHAMVPILFIAMFVTTAQRAVVGGLDFSFLRILVCLGWARVLMFGEARGFKMIALDKIMVCWGVVFVLATAIREGVSAYCFGWTVDNIGAYLLFRVLVRSRDEIYQVVRWAAFFTIPVAVVFWNELMTGRNLFSAFGGVPEVTMIREGKLRCQGPFTHPILAGCFYACLLPLFACLWRGSANSRPMKFVCVGGMFAAAVVVFCSSSSTSTGAALAGIAALMLFKQHKMTPFIRWSAFGTLVLLHLIMKGPVWSLLARVDLTGGSTGFHRYLLVDATIRHFSEWALVGVSSTAHWGRHLYDVTGHFVMQCTHGGLMSLVLFVGVLTLAFRAVRRVIQRSPDPWDHLLAWAVGAALFAQCVAFIGVSYFGTTLLLMLLQLAMLGSLEAGTTPQRSVAVSANSRWKGAAAVSRGSARERVHAGPDTSSPELSGDD